MMAFQILRIDLRDFAPLTFARNHRPSSRRHAIGNLFDSNFPQGLPAHDRACENGRIATRYSNLMTAVATETAKETPPGSASLLGVGQANPPQAGPPDFPESKFYKIRSEVKGSLWCQRPRDVTGGSARAST